MMNSKRIIRDICQLYEKAGFLIRPYIRIKFKICPLLKLEAYLPKDGKILDLGCGIGLFSNLLNLSSPARIIEGHDIDKDKIHMAVDTVGSRENLSFSIRQIQDIGPYDYDAIIISDTLYLIPYAQQEAVLKSCFSKLKDTGLLLIKEIDKKPTWKFIFNFFHEVLAVKVFRFTEGNKFFFRSSLEYKSLLSGIGFKVEILQLARGFAYPHIAYICRKNMLNKP